jgi:DNA (cytosine-5)-methyltransferase 1
MPGPETSNIVYGSVCSGIEAATAAWEPLGWKPAWFSEIEPFPSAVLQHHYPNVPNLGDMTKLHEHISFTPGISVLVGGTPCQSFSIAGLRKGLRDARGNLALVFCQLAKRIQPRWIVWENVPGVLSSKKGKDFGSFVRALVECGYGVSWRVLDAQNFGVPQRRRRVFLVGHLGDWRPAVSVLFDQRGLQGIAKTCAKEGLDFGEDAVTATGRIDCTSRGISGAVTSKWSKGSGGPAGDEHYNLVVSAIDFRNSALSTVSPTLQTNGRSLNALPGVIALQDISGRDKQQNGCGWSDAGISYTLDAAATQGVMSADRIRRLTPLECERLQGFPDNYTRIPYNGKSAWQCPVSVRYKALGNSMAVPVMRWIGERIELVESVLREQEECPEQSQ